MQEPADAPAPLGWRRLWAAVRGDAPHLGSPGELGEYADLLLQSGPRQARQVFPTLARHVAFCARCNADLQALLGWLCEHAGEHGWTVDGVRRVS